MINPSSSETQRSIGPVTGHRTSNLLSLLEDRPSRKNSKNRRAPSGELQLSRSSSPLPSQLKIFRQLTNMDTSTAIRRERQKFKIFSTLSLAGQIFMGVVSLYVFSIYLAQTYMQLPGENSKNFALEIAEYLALTLIVFDLVNQIFFISESNLKALFSLTTVFDVLTITMLALKLRPCTGFFRLIQFNKFVQFARTWRLIYKNSQSQSFKLSQQLITTQFVVVVIEVISFFMMASAIFLVLNRHFPVEFAISSPDDSPQHFTFVSALYFTLITVTTLGYGDYYPNAPWNRMLDCFFFITAVVWLTLVTQKISQLYSQRGKYLSRYRIHTKRIKHVVVAGRYLSSLKLRGFLRQFFHPDHGSIKDTKSVIILDQRPDSELLDVINEYSDNTHIILGDFFDDNILEKAQIKKAEAVFLLSSARENMTQNADMFVVLASHKANLVKSTMRINAQINSKNFMMHNWCGWSNVYSIQEFKMGILAANAFNPGFCPMILNLLRSSSKYAFKEQKPWLLQYNQGLEHEIYLIPGRVCQGVKFSELVKNAYNSRGALVIGVKNREERSHTLRRNAVQNSAIEDRKNVWLNPMDHKIQGTDQIIVLAKDSIHARTAVQPENWRFMSGAEDFGSFQNKVTLKTSTKSASSQKKGKASRFAPYSDENVRRSVKGNLYNEKDDLEDQDQSPVAKKSITLDDLKFSKNYDYKLPKKLPNQYFPIWKSYVKNLTNHILVFGEVEAAVSLIDILCLFTSNFICYVSDRPMDQAWEQLMSNKPPNILYFECSFSNPKELKKTGIESAQHVIVLSWMLQGSNSHDSGMLQIVRTIEEFFPQVKYTLELVDQANIKFIGCHKEDLKLPLTCKSSFASGKLLYTSTLEAIVAQVRNCNTFRFITMTQFCRQ